MNLSDLARLATRRATPTARALYAATGLWLALAFVLAVLALWGFVALADEVMEGTTRAFDHAIIAWMDARALATLDRWARSVTELGAWLVVATMALLVSVFLRIHGERRAVVLLWVALIGVVLITAVLKAVFARERPDLMEWRTVHAQGYAFPSGHALNATVAYTLFAFLVARIERSRALRAATFGVAALLIVLVAVSRVYLGVHFPSDVVAGVLIGFAWAMACVFAVYVLSDARSPGEPRNPGEPGSPGGPGGPNA